MLLFVGAYLYAALAGTAPWPCAAGGSWRIGKRVKARQVMDLKGRTVLRQASRHARPSGAPGQWRTRAAAACRRMPGPQRAARTGSPPALKAAKPGEWIERRPVAGLAARRARRSPPRRSMRVSPDNPVMLFDVSGHSVWANSRALAEAGIGPGTANPEGGIIERDAAGQSHRRAARNRRTDCSRPRSRRRRRDKTERHPAGHLTMLAGLGVVGYVEAMAYRDDLKVYAALADKGVLKHRCAGLHRLFGIGQAQPSLRPDPGRTRRQFARATFNTDCVKVFADGVPTESHTGAMSGRTDQAGQPNAPAQGPAAVRSCRDGDRT